MDASTLSTQEEQLLQLFLDICPQWSDIIFAQLKSVSLQRFATNTNCSTEFCCNTFVPALPITSTMPIEVLLGEVALFSESSYMSVGNFKIVNANSTISSNATDTAAAVRLYLENGILSELELYSISGKPIDFSNLATKQRIYVIHDSALNIEIGKQHLKTD